MYILHKTKASVEIEAIQQICQLDNLKAKDYRVLFLLMGHIDGRSFRKVNPSQMAHELSIKKKDIKKSIRKLVEVELLEKGSNEHVKEGYRFKF